MIKAATNAILLAALLTIAWSNPKNVRLAEEAFKEGDYRRASQYFRDALEEFVEENSDTLPTLLFNAGLAYLKDNNFSEAAKCLESALNQSDDPTLQNKILISLGNLSFKKAKSSLDEGNVFVAKKSWIEAKKYYEKAKFHANPLADRNLELLEKQIIEAHSKIAIIEGVVWRDRDGNGRKDSNEEPLDAFVFWDKNNDGEYNSTVEFGLDTDNNSTGFFAFLTTADGLTLGSLLKNSSDQALVPWYGKGIDKKIDINSPGRLSFNIPWRAAPKIQGKVWNDKNQNGLLDENESGSSAVTLFIDENNNSIADENETTFKPDNKGIFSKLVPRGSYVISAKPDHPDTNFTYPKSDPKSYFVEVDFERPSEELLFGLSPSQSSEPSESEKNEDNSSEENSDQENEEDKPNESSEDKDLSAEENQTRDTSGLVERMMQDILSETTVYDVSELEKWEQAPPGRND